MIFFFKFNQIIYALYSIAVKSYKPLTLILFEILHLQCLKYKTGNIARMMNSVQGLNRE